MNIDDFQSTYKVRKISGGDETKEDRIYQIDANMHFQINKENTQEKINYTQNILNNLTEKYYKIFQEKCNQILEMNDEE